MSIELMMKEFQDIAYSPNQQLSNFKAQGKKVIGVLPYYAPEELVYAPAFGFVYNNMEEMVRAYCKAPNSVCIEQGVAWREGICRDNKVDGVLVHYNRSCKPWSGYMAEMQRRFTADLGIPCAGFDGDQADPRNFNAAQYETRVQGLVEAMEQNAMNKEG